MVLALLSQDSILLGKNSFVYSNYTRLVLPCYNKFRFPTGRKYFAPLNYTLS